MHRSCTEYRLYHRRYRYSVRPSVYVRSVFIVEVSYFCKRFIRLPFSLGDMIINVTRSSVIETQRAPFALAFAVQAGPIFLYLLFAEK